MGERVFKIPKSALECETQQKTKEKNASQQSNFHCNCKCNVEVFACELMVRRGEKVKLR